MLDSVVDLVSGSPWTYVALFAIAALDAIVPLVPSEASVIAGGVLAADGELELLLVVPVAALGAFAGDNGSYAVGTLVRRRTARKLFRGDRGQRTLAWAERTLRRRGPVVLVIARFVPGGRTAATLTAGLVHYPWRERFVPFDALAASVWAVYSALLGYAGGEAFGETWKGLVLALGIAAAIAAGAEALTRLRGR